MQFFVLCKWLSTEDYLTSLVATDAIEWQLTNDIVMAWFESDRLECGNISWSYEELENAKQTIYFFIFAHIFFFLFLFLNYLFFKSLIFVHIWKKLSKKSFIG